MTYDELCAAVEQGFKDAQEDFPDVPLESYYLDIAEAVILAEAYQCSSEVIVAVADRYDVKHRIIRLLT